MKRLALISMTLCLAFLIHAQTPQKFNYQAVVRDGTGKPLTNKSVSFQISILQGSENGTTVYTETHFATSNTLGVITLQIGGGTTSGNFSAINWSSGNYYLKVEMDASGGADYALYSTSQLLSVPYSLYAATASTADSVRSIKDTDGDTKIITEYSADEDYISFYTNGSPRIVISPIGTIEPADDNFFIGKYSGTNNSGGFENYGIGSHTLNSNVSGNYNMAFGQMALRNNTSGDNNIALGRFALRGNTTSSNCIAIGSYSLYSQKADFDTLNNIAIGSFALEENNPKSTSDGRDNIAVGYKALKKNTTGFSNQAFGNYSMQKNTTGNQNSAFGKYSLYSNTSGFQNTAFGENSLKSNTIAVYNTAIGFSSMILNETGNFNTAVGADALHSNLTGGSNTAVGMNSGSKCKGNYNTFVGVNADISTISLVLTNATAIGYGATVSASNNIRLGNTSVTVIEGQVAFTSASDERLKKNIKDINAGLDFIMKLHPVEFQMKEGDDRLNFGFIAQDIEKLVGTNNSILTIGGDEERTMGLRYTDFIAPMVKALQEQQKQIDLLKQQNELLLQMINELKK